MTAPIILQVLLFAIAVSMDAFAVSVTDGLIYKDINKKHALFIAGVFGLMQALMPLIGYWIVEGATIAVGNIIASVVTWVAFALLLIVGGKMIYSGIKAVRTTTKRESKDFSAKEVLLFGLITSIDALAVGVSFHTGISDNVSIWLHVSMILICTFIISLLGILLGNVFNRLLKGKYEIADIVGGSILVILAIWVVVSHYVL